MGTALSVSASPVGLENGRTYYATVRFVPQYESVVVDEMESLRVGLFVDRTLSVASQVAEQLTVNQKHLGMAADQIRPLVYITQGDEGIYAYDIYTGNQVTVYPGVGEDLRKLAISDDGQFLFAVDHFHQQISKLDLTSQALTILKPDAWSDCQTCLDTYSYVDLQYRRASGREILVAAGPQIIDANTGQILGGSSDSMPVGAVVEASGDGKVVFMASTRGAPHDVYRYLLQYNYFDEIFEVARTAGGGGSAYARGYSTDHSGSKLYRACWYPGEIEVYDGQSLQFDSYVSSGTNGGAKLISDTLLMCARYYSDLNGGPSIWFYNLINGEIAGEITVGGNIDERSFVISGDGQPVITLSNDRSNLVFSPVTLGAIP